MNIVTKAAGVVLARRRAVRDRRERRARRHPHQPPARRRRVEQHLAQPVESGGCAAVLARVPHLQPDHDPVDACRVDQRRQQLRRRAGDRVGAS